VSRTKKPSKMELQLRPHLDAILNGSILSIDPSSGSKNSQPGYAIYRAGQLVDSGFIAVKAGEALHKRLFYLGNCLREQFEKPDVVVTENIPPFFPKEGESRFFNMSIVSLQRAVGVVQAAFDVPVIEVAPITWRKNIPDNYRKTDEADAIMLGLTVIKSACGIAGRPEPVLSERVLHKLKTDEWLKATGIDGDGA
jgi:hypothetical protein